MIKYLGLSAILFAIGAFGVVARRNLLIVLMSLELMFNAVNLAIVALARMTGTPGGHVFVLMVMAVAAAEVAVGLALVIALFRQKRTVDTEAYRAMKG